MSVHVEPSGRPQPPGGTEESLPEDQKLDKGDSVRTYSDASQPGDKENPFRDPKLNGKLSVQGVKLINGDARSKSVSGVQRAVPADVQSRLAKSQSVIESLQRSLGTKISPETIETLKTKYASTDKVAPLAEREPSFDEPSSPLLQAKRRAEEKRVLNGSREPKFDVSSLQSQRRDKLAFLSGDPSLQVNPEEGRNSSFRASGSRKPSQVPERRTVTGSRPKTIETSKLFPKSSPTKPPVPIKRDILRGLIQPKPLGVPKLTSAKKKVTPKSPKQKEGQRDGFAELLKNLVSDSTNTTSWSSKSSEKSRGGGSEEESYISSDKIVITAPTVEIPGNTRAAADHRLLPPQPAPRSTVITREVQQKKTSCVLVETTFLSNPPLSPLSPTPSSRDSIASSTHHNLSLQSPSERDSSTSPCRTPGERSHILEERLNEIRKDLWSDEAQSQPPDARVSHPDSNRRRYDSLPTSPVSEPSSAPSKSVQEETLEHYARAIQKHLDGHGDVPVAPRLQELRVDTDYSSVHSSTSTLVSSPSPGTWHQLKTTSGGSDSRIYSRDEAERYRKPQSLPPTPVQHHSRERTRRLTAPVEFSENISPSGSQKKKLREELLGFYYRSLERDSHKNQVYGVLPGRSGRLSAPPASYSDYGQSRVVIPVQNATFTPDRTLRQEFLPPGQAAVNAPTKIGRPPPSPHSGARATLAVQLPPNKASKPRESNYQNVQIIQRGARRPTQLVKPGSPSLASAEDSDSTLSYISQDSRQRVRSPDSMNFFVRGAPQRNTIGAISTSKKTPPRDEVDLRREFGGNVELRHPEKLHALKKRNNSESESANGKLKPGKSSVFEAWSTNGKSPKDGSGKKNKTNGTPPSTGKKPTFFAPIFRKGSLHPSSPGDVSDCASTPPPTLPKRVSFSSASSPTYTTRERFSDQGVDYWPTRNGPAPTPPTRPSRLDSSDSVFLPASPASPHGYISDSEVYARHYTPRHHQQQIYANQYATNLANDEAARRCNMGSPNGVPATPPNRLPLGNETYVNYTMPTPPQVISPVTEPSPLRVIQKMSPGNGPVYSPGCSPGSPQHQGHPKIAPKPMVYVNMNRAASATPTMMSMAPDRPLPPVPRDARSLQQQEIYEATAGVTTETRVSAPAPNTADSRWMSESESGSEAGEVQRILQQANDKGKITYFRFQEEEWGGKGRGTGDQTGPPGGGVRGDEEMRRGGGRGGRAGRDDPRRHTLSGDQHPHPQGGTLSRSMDLEMSSKQRRKSPMARGYPPPSNAMLFDDDPGIMSEVETSSTGFHRGGKQRSSLPVVRTPSKTLERPLGLVFLQYRNETKRALLPNEITSLDTVKALFVRSFSKQLSMEYLDSPLVKIYIHDSNKDMFYELEDHRSHLRDIRDRSVLRLFESTDVHGGVLPGAGTGLVAPPLWEQDQSYFSEPEFDSEFQHQHIHKSKASKGSSVPPQAYYMTHSYPPGSGQPGPGSSATLPRGGLRAYSPAPVPADRLKTLPQSDRLHAESGYMSSPERGGPRAYPVPYPPAAAVPYEEGYYGQYGTRSGSITPVIDEEASDTELMDEQYSLYGVKLPGGGVMGPRGPPSAARAPFPAPAGAPYDTTRIRVENMERQLANLTGLVQKALTHGPTHLAVPGARDAYRNASGEFDKQSSSSSASLPDDSTYVRSDVKPPKLGKDKSVSFEKSVSFSDEPPDMNSPKQHSPQHGERDRHKPAPPPKPMSLSPGQYEGRNIYRDLQLTPEMYNQLRGLQKKAKDLRQEVRNLRRMSQAQAHSVRETIRDTFIKIRAMLITGAEGSWAAIGDAEKLRLSREEELYKQEMLRLEKDLTELESTVEELRGNVINRKTRVNMSDVENMALVLSKSSKTVADLKVRFPGLQDEMKSLLSAEMEKVMREEKFLKEEPERLESALRRCKKLTGTLVTLKRLASVQEQRLPGPIGAVTADARLSPTLDDEPLPPTPNSSSSKVPTRSPPEMAK